MINLFEVNDMQSIFDHAGQDILINNVTQKAIISNPAISEYEERYIHTLTSVSRGDLIGLEGASYLTITESITKRNGKYKALIRHCNESIEIKIYTQELVGYDEYGKPIYQDVYDHSDFVPAIVDTKSFSIDGDNAINVPNNQIVVIMQDNESNKGNFIANYEFEVVEKTWKVLNVDSTKNGLLILTCEIVPT